MPIYETKLLGKEKVAEGTLAFYFERPPGFAHEAGQSAVFTLADPPPMDSLGASRPFTIASAPHEPDLMIATRMRATSFKQFLESAPRGVRLRIDGPAGVMVLHEEAFRPAVFLAGGIGVTPFLSMARHAARQRLPHRIQLFYSNRRVEDAPFLAELGALQKENPNFRLVATMTGTSTSSRPWNGERRTIGRELLEAHVADLSAPVYYFAGPPGMAMAMQAMLSDLGIEENDMRSEEFYGY